MTDRDTEGFVPSKRCPACDCTFTWNKKWAHCWHRVVYCGPSCREEAEEAESTTETLGDEQLEAAE